MGKMNLLVLFVINLVIISLLSCSKSLNPSVVKKPSSSSVIDTVATNPNYQLIWSDEFNGNGSFDTSKWSFCNRGTSAWAKYLTNDSSYAYTNGRMLELRMDDSVIIGDPVAYHSGGIQSARKFNITYGKVEVRAKFTSGQGSWPAIWMMPDTPAAYGSWPNSGEIDIMEHINFENVVHQTLHNALVTSSSGGSSATHSDSFNKSDFNIYSVIWTPTTIKFYVNNQLAYTYSKAADADYHQWPYDKPFYIILNQSGGAGWPGMITNSNLPFIMDVDYVRVYKNF